jgi:hypothetical protein
MEPQALSWIRIIEQAIGIVLGGGITILGIYFKERFDRRRAIQSWYEQQFITEGIDPVLGFVMTAQYQLLDQAKGGVVLSEVECDPLPLDALNRLFTILHTTELTALIMNLNIAITMKLNPAVKEALMPLCQPALMGVHALQQALLKMQIKKKSDIYLIGEVKEVVKVLEFIQKTSGEANKALTDAGEQAKQLIEGQKKISYRKR